MEINTHKNALKALQIIKICNKNGSAAVVCSVKSAKKLVIITSLNNGADPELSLARPLYEEHTPALTHTHTHHING